MRTLGDPQKATSRLPDAHRVRSPGPKPSPANQWQAFATSMRGRHAMDPHEIEAERVASAVMHPRGRGPIIIGEAASEAGIPVSAEVERTLAARRGAGSPLPGDARSTMEERFGVDFGDVRIHATSTSSPLHHAVGTEAFTAGRDIYVHPHAYTPGTTRGRRILAHELTHVVQQAGGTHRMGQTAPSAAPTRVQGWDPGPLPSDDSRVPRSAEEVRRERVARFDGWHAQELRDLSWNDDLPACPCQLRLTEGAIYGHNAANPDPSIWNDPTTWLWGYHEGAQWCMRSRTPTSTGAGEQCCYDDAGAFITHGSGAGSADRVSPEDFFGHQAADVEYADLATAIDGGSFGAFSRRYLQVRPTNNKNGCPSNT